MGCSGVARPGTRTTGERWNPGKAGRRGLPVDAVLGSQGSRAREGLQRQILCVLPFRDSSAHPHFVTVPAPPRRNTTILCDLCDSASIPPGGAEHRRRRLYFGMPTAGATVALVLVASLAVSATAVVLLARF